MMMFGRNKQKNWSYIFSYFDLHTFKFLYLNQYVLVLNHLTLNAFVSLLYIIQPQSICIHVKRRPVHVFVVSKDLSSTLHDCALADIKQGKRQACCCN